LLLAAVKESVVVSGYEKPNAQEIINEELNIIKKYNASGIATLTTSYGKAIMYSPFIENIITIVNKRPIKAVGYGIALVTAPFLTVCSCTMVPLFAGIIYSGAEIGPAITFLLMAPSSNILAILLTGDMLYWELAEARILASIIVSLTAGLIISKTPWGKAIEKEYSVNNASQQEKTIEIVKSPLDERLLSALKFGGYLAKQILPFFILGLIAVSYVEAYLPEDIVGEYLTGVKGVLIASVLGGPLYTPTLVEIVIGKGLWSLGMSKGALLAWLMGQPYDIANALAVSRIAKWKVVLTYMLIAWIGSVIFGLIYGIISGSL